MNIVIPAGQQSREVEAHGKFLRIRSANKPFSLTVVFKDGSSYTFPCKESDRIPRMDQPFKKLIFAKLDDTDTDIFYIVFDALPFEIVNDGSGRVPPTATNPYGIFNLVNIGDVSEKFGGSTADGKRRMKVTLSLTTPTLGDSVRIYNGSNVGDCVDANTLFTLSFYKPVWTEIVDCNVICKVISKAGASIDVEGYEANMHP